MREIPLTRGHVAILDDEDFDRFAAFRWHANVQGVCIYARRCVRLDGRQRSEYLHRAVLDAPKHLVVDHVNGNTLDNRRANLRLLTQPENCRNHGPRHGTSAFKGVRWHYLYQRWYAQIGVAGQNLHLGVFDNEEDAARAYDAAALIHFGGLARLNFPAGVDVAAQVQP